ncbi:MAG: AAA family ATPase [Bacteroidota bacterium]
MKLAMEKAELIIISGANGVGKTTFAEPYVTDLGYKFLNADEIAKKIEQQGFANAMIKAGRIFFSELNNSISQRESIVIETTLSGSYINKLAVKAKKLGYHVKLIYIFVDSEELCIERVKSRVIKGGHDVPEEDIRRRFQRSLHNFWDNFTKISNSWILLYNGDENYREVAVGSENEFSVENDELFNHFKQIKQ